MTPPFLRFERALWPLAVVVHTGASAALVGAGIGHSLSIRDKAVAGTLAAVSNLPHGVLYGIGVALAAAGLIGLWAAAAMWRARSLKPAWRSAWLALCTVAAIVVAFTEPRGLPFLGPPAVDLLILRLARSRRSFFA